MCTFQTGKFTGWGSESVNDTLLMLQAFVVEVLGDDGHNAAYAEPKPVYFKIGFGRTTLKMLQAV